MNMVVAPYNGSANRFNLNGERIDGSPHRTRWRKSREVWGEMPNQPSALGTPLHSDQAHLPADDPNLSDYLGT